MALTLVDNVTTKTAFGTTDKWLRIDTTRERDHLRTLYVTPSAAALWSVGLVDAAAFDATIAHPLAANVTTAIPVPPGGRICVGSAGVAATFVATVIPTDFR